ncbi:MAG: permease-like cell division protein FtsX [Candidatus Shapirobacteria bacterium]|nr:permease-like cell division protein FtsX [Candidatus Shapirobacteria bacterium]MDD4410574.1 permease-like cell division protein FtsX [Candidatus Shapirobacteria bacterium]
MNPLKTTWHHIRRSPFQSLIAAIVMVLSFFFISLFAIINSGLSSVLSYFETKPEITLFLKDGLDKTTVENIQKDLSSYQSIKEITFVSKEKALSIYKEQNKDNPLLTEMVTASILPASFEITVTNPQILEEIYQNYSTKTTVIDEIIYQKDIIQSLLDWTSATRKIGIAIILIISLISFLTIVTIIGMKITNRKDEIKISRLIGASNFYVKKPFLLEGIIYGIVGSTLGFLFSFLIALISQKSINSFFQPVVFIDLNINFYLILLVAEIFIGTFLGFFASWIGVKRYIKY